ncbi:MAG: leucine-rich repeat domain-containing protein [Tannerella sp.]|nr:leucine-rich repeat domain-containing protein [Tannerella sp.]
MKKNFILVLAMMLLPAAGFAQTSGRAGSLEWSIENNTLTISGTGAMDDYDYESDGDITTAPWGVSFTSVIIKQGVTSIGEFAFAACSGLTSVTFPNSLTDIEGAAFAACSGLTSITLPNSLTSIGDGAFLGCSGLTSITLSNSLTSIGDGAFMDCSGLTSVSLPNSLTSIGKKTFAYCSGLTSVTVEWGQPLIAGEILGGPDLKKSTLHVPAGTKSLYEAADVWKEFGRIVEQ